MSTFFEEDSETKGLLEHAPSSPETPRNLKAKLRTMASTTVRRPSKWPARLTLAAVTTVAVAVIAISMAPTKAWSFSQIVNAVDKTNTFQFSFTTSEGGSDHQVVVAGKSGKFVLRADNDAVMQLDNDRMTIYNPKDNTVVDLKIGEQIGQFIDPKMIAAEMQKSFSQVVKELDIKKMMAEYAKEYGEDSIKVGPILQKFGKSTYGVTMQNPKQPERVDMVINADTDLPMSLVVSKRQEDGTWASKDKIEMQFGGDVDAAFAHINIPANAKHQTLDLSELTKKGLESLPFGRRGTDDDHQPDVKDVQVERSGSTEIIDKGR